ncbi:hypothetical protein QBC46DRAFT_417090 [Diplogelasinospora grovesii]|uniref:Uncharacterized protein n=1 Tax=Diplogelasinospora grovesii TaxID=303347 RepID=A0AAN6N3G3_9PEZI|nr:hypothetical protein QBC46DRAFT_417090 [Diplogelasinospora grovesii]
MYRMYTTTSVLTLAALASTATASLKINNWCSETVYIYQSNNGLCDSGPNAICSGSPGAAPYVIPAGSGQSSSVIDLGWIKNGHGTAVKMSKGDASFRSGILQYEYTWAPGDGLYWDLSDLDGSGPGLVGTPFAHDNVKIGPTGAGEGQGTCVKIRCAAGQLCRNAYQTPDDSDTRWCPLDTGDMWIDLCQPTPAFNNKREVKFSA